MGWYKLCSQLNTWTNANSNEFTWSPRETYSPRNLTCTSKYKPLRYCIANWDHRFNSFCYIIAPLSVSSPILVHRVQPHLLSEQHVTYSPSRAHAHSFDGYVGSEPNGAETIPIRQRTQEKGLRHQPLIKEARVGKGRHKQGSVWFQPLANKSTSHRMCT